MISLILSCFIEQSLHIYNNIKKEQALGGVLALETTKIIT